MSPVVARIGCAGRCARRIGDVVVVVVDEGIWSRSKYFAPASPEGQFDTRIIADMDHTERGPAVAAVDDL